MRKLLINSVLIFLLLFPASGQAASTANEVSNQSEMRFLCKAMMNQFVGLALNGTQETLSETRQSKSLLNLMTVDCYKAFMLAVRQMDARQGGERVQIFDILTVRVRPNINWYGEDAMGMSTFPAGTLQIESHYETTLRHPTRQSIFESVETKKGWLIMALVPDDDSTWGWRIAGVIIQEAVR